MKNFIFFVFIATITSAQEVSVAEYVYVNKIINYKSKGVLTFTPKHAHYKILKSEDGTEEQRTVDENGNINIVLADSDERPEWYINRVSNTLTEKDSEYLSFILTEEIPKIAWKIEQEFKDLNTLTCQKASGYFRGRTYIVWFAMDIPVPYGPWKLHGLPGLIVEASDDKGLLVFRLSKYIPNSSEHTPIKPFKGKQMALKDYILEEVPKIRKKEEEYLAYMRSLNTDRDTFIVESSTSVLKNPGSLELIYEWEEEATQKE